MKRAVLLIAAASTAWGHDIITTKVTFDREIVRLFNAHCISCHREGGTAFSLATYQQSRPWAKAIGEEVLRRRMPPWGAVKGFGDFRDDQGLTPEQLELIVDWEEGGAPEGEPRDLPQVNEKPPGVPLAHPADELVVAGETKLARAMILGALWPMELPDAASFRITAELPDGAIYPLVWLSNFKMMFNHPFIFRNPLKLPAGTFIRGIPRTGAKLALIPASDVPPPPKYVPKLLAGDTAHSQ
jgi:hypothetical protein